MIDPGYTTVNTKPSFTELVKRGANTAGRVGTNVYNFAKDNPALIAGIVGTINALTSDSKNRSVFNNPITTALLTYGGLKLLPALNNVGSLVNNANYASIEAQALMAKGHHLADNIMSAPLLFGRKKAIQQIQRDAVNKGNQVYYDAYQRARQSGKLRSNYGMHQIEAIKNELRNMG